MLLASKEQVHVIMGKRFGSFEQVVGEELLEIDDVLDIMDKEDVKDVHEAQKKVAFFPNAGFCVFIGGTRPKSHLPRLISDGFGLV